MAENIGSQSIEERRRQRSETRQTQTYKAFLKDLCSTGNFDEAKAEKAATSVLCLLEQRIMWDEAKDLNSQLPQKLTNMLQRCERHEGVERSRDLTRQKLLESVCADLGINDEKEAESTIRAVFATVRQHVSEGEIEQVVNQLPPDWRPLWQRPA